LVKAAALRLARQATPGTPASDTLDCVRITLLPLEAVGKGIGVWMAELAETIVVLLGGLVLLDSHKAPASSWCDTDQRRGEIRQQRRADAGTSDQGTRSLTCHGSLNREDIRCSEEDQVHTGTAHARLFVQRSRHGGNDLPGLPDRPRLLPNDGQHRTYQYGNPKFRVATTC
jgi:hypothetical protein